MLLDYSSDPSPPRRRPQWTDTGALLALTAAVFALLKSRRYHGHGQLREEQAATLLLVIVSGVCVLVTVALLPRYVRRGSRRAGPALLVGACVLAVLIDLAAVYGMLTATKGAKDILSISIGTVSSSASQRLSGSADVFSFGLTG
jgi:drug/metabolite transporter (DMT)-like permease